MHTPPIAQQTQSHPHLHAAHLSELEVKEVVKEKAKDEGELSEAGKHNRRKIAMNTFCARKTGISVVRDFVANWWVNISTWRPGVM